MLDFKKSKNSFFTSKKKDVYRNKSRFSKPLVTARSERTLSSSRRRVQSKLWLSSSLFAGNLDWSKWLADLKRKWFGQKRANFNSKILDLSQELTESADLVVTDSYVYDKKNKLKVFKPKKDWQNNSSNLKQTSKAVSILSLDGQRLSLLNFWRLRGQSKNKLAWIYTSSSILSKNFHRYSLILLVSSLLLFFIYLSFFDTYFLVKNYRIFFAKNSFLAKKETENLLNLFQNKKILGLFPSNQYWFLNEKNLTFIAQQKYPWIQSVRIVDRKWPNQISLEIKTQPILLTLRIVENNREKFWRVGPDGQIWTLDEANLKENLVWVENSISFDRPNFTLQDYPLFKEEKSINRIYFILTLWEYLKELGIEVDVTILPNLLDNDVIIQTKNGTRLLFDVVAFDRKSQRERLQVVFNSQIRNQEKNQELAYIDFRISRRVFVCPKNAQCAKFLT